MGLIQKVKKAKPFLPLWVFAWSLPLLLGGLLICVGLATHDVKPSSVVEGLFIIFGGLAILFGMVVLFTGPCSRILLDPEVCERYNEAKQRERALYREEIRAFRRKELEELKSRVDKLEATQDKSE